MIVKNIVPRTHNEGTLGTVRKKWAAVYATEIPLIDTKLQDYTTTIELNSLLANKADIEDVPTKVSELTNDAGYITNAVNDLVNYYTSSNTYTKEEVNNLLSAIPKYSTEVVDSLPTTNISLSKIYLVRTGEDDNNLYTEYIRINDTWEKLGTQHIDISGKADINHNQASNTINAMTGYSKAATVSAITTSDSLNDAIGKLEKALDSKQESGSYLASNGTAVNSNQLDGHEASYFAKADDIQTYTSGTGINVAGDNSINLAVSGVTANSYGPTANVTGTDGATIVIPNITVDAYGRVTSVTEYTLTNSDKNDQTITGVKGSAEATYRTGNVEITQANLGITSDSTSGGTENSSAYITSGAVYSKIQDLITMINNKQELDALERSTTYALGDQLSDSSLGNGLYLECIQGGTTGESAPEELSE